MSAALYTAEPATSTLAPAATATGAVAGPMPPSTSSSQSRPRLWIQPRMARTLSIMSGMKAWPPKPGSTVITSTMAHWSRKGRTASAGVLGLMTTPGRLPWARISSRAFPVFSSVSASTWTVTMSAPAWQKASTYRTGRSIIRWTSRGRAVVGRMDLTTGMPMVMLGTNSPSITSTWT